MSMQLLRKLPTPQEIKESIPLSPELAAMKAERDREIADILTGASHKFILIIGPCSADSADPVIEYISRLRKVQELSLIHI